MPTLQEKKEYIREKAIEANPDKFKVPKDLPLPVKYDGVVYYWGKDGEMVADFDSGVNTGDGFRIRGWGRIQDEQSQDDCARYIERAINAYSDIQLTDILLAMEKVDRPVDVSSKGEFIDARIWGEIKNDTLHLFKYDLTKSYYDQKDEVYESIYQILSSK